MPRRRRVFHLIKSLGRGGAEIVLDLTLRFGDSERFEYAFGYFLPWKDAMAGELRRRGAEVVCFEAPGELAMLRSAGRVARHLREWRADLLHCHLPLSGVVGRWAGRLAGVPIVYTEHNVQERYKFVTRRLNLLTWGLQDRVIAVSGVVADSIARRKDTSVPVVIVRNGVDVKQFRPGVADGGAVRRAFGIAADAPVVGTVSVFRPEKGLFDWIAAARRVAQRLPRTRFLMVGDGKLREDLRRAADAAGIGDAMIFCGIQEDVRPYLAAMDVFLMTSFFEGLPVALLEAMAMARPAVATYVGGIPEILRAGENGVLVRPRAPEEAASGVLEMLKDPPRAARLAAAGRRTVEESFSAVSMARGIEAVYDEVLAARG